MNENKNQRHGFRRVTALLLALLMLLSTTVVLAACVVDSDSDSSSSTDQETEAKTDAATSGASSETSAPETTGDTATETETDGSTAAKRGTPYSDLNKTKQYDGKSLAILSRDELNKTDFELDDEGTSSAILGEMVVTRNSVIEADYGVSLSMTYETDYIKVGEIVEQQFMGGLDEYDVAIGHKYSFTSCAAKGYLADLNQISALNLSGEWWDQGAVNNLALRGKLFLVTGDILPTSLLASSCFVFNKTMLSALGKDEPYDLVRSGDWTLDAFNELTADVTNDITGDGELVYDEDRFGFTTWMMDVPFSTFYGAGGMLVTTDENGEPQLTEDYDSILNRYEKIYKAIVTQQAYFVTDPTGELYPTSYECFAEGHALFYDGTLSKVKNFLSDMDQDYGIVPVPKYDSKQEQYQTFVNGAAGFIMIIGTEPEQEFVGTMLEAMACYNYENISPRLYNVIVKSQNVRDEESSEMIEYIIYNRVYDLAYFFDLTLSNSVLNQLKESKTMGVSVLKKDRRASNTELKKILKDLK